MEENNARIHNMLDSHIVSSRAIGSNCAVVPRNEPLPLCTPGSSIRRRNCSPPVESAKESVADRGADETCSPTRRYNGEMCTSNGEKMRSNTQDGETGRVRLADVFPSFADDVSSKANGGDGTPQSSVRDKNGGKAMLSLRNKLIDEMGNEVWVEVKEQENQWDWDEPVMTRLESMRPSNALNEDQYDFAIILKNNLDDRTATAVREKRRLWKLNKSKKKGGGNLENEDGDGNKPDGGTVTDDFSDDFSDDDEGGDASAGDDEEAGAKPNAFMASLQVHRQKKRRKARYKEEDDDFAHPDSGDEGGKEGGRGEDAPPAGSAAPPAGSFFAPVRLDGSKTLRAVVKRLRDAGLLVRRLKSINGNETLLKIRATQGRLEQEAERMKLSMRTRAGGWKRFQVGNRDSFCGAGYAGVLFRSSDRQSIIRNIVKLPKQYDGAGLGPESPYAPAITAMFPLHMYARLRGLRNGWVKFWNPPLQSRFITKDADGRGAGGPGGSSGGDGGKPKGCLSRCLRSTWNFSLCGMLNQPLDAISEYFGENVAFYFAYLQFYTKWLIIPSIVGVGLFVLQVQAGTIDHPLLPFYSMFMAVWATMFLLFWRRRSSEFAYRWGVLHHEEEEVSRPEFHGEARRSEVTGEWELYYPAWRRVLKQLLGFPISGAWLAGILVGMVVLFDLRDNLIEKLSGGADAANATVTAAGASGGAVANATSLATPPEAKSSGSFLHFGYADDNERMSLDMYDQKHYGDISFWAYLLLPPLTYGFMIPLLDAMYKKLATWLNRWENHRTETAYQNSLITKVVLFKLINAFCSLYYFAFSGRHPILRLTAQLASFMIAGQILNNMQEIVLPCLKNKVKKTLAQRKIRKTLEKKSLGRRRISQAMSTGWDEARMPVYDTFADYAEMTVQFGYITFFSLAFPLAPLCALVNNIVELRSDAYKLCYNMQRPVARKAGGIGVWFPILRAMTVVSVMTNLAIIGFTTRQLETYFPAWSSTEKMFAVFVIEHAIIAVMYVINALIPSLPQWVVVEKARELYRNKKDVGKEGMDRGAEK